MGVQLTMRYVAILFGVGILLLTYDLWCTHVRSLIPISMAAEKVVVMETRTEKHPGSDDVCLIQTHSNSFALTYATRHIDSAIHQSLAVGDILNKNAGETFLTVNDEKVALKYSADATGMLRAHAVNGLVLIVLLVLGMMNRTSHVVGSVENKA